MGSNRCGILLRGHRSLQSGHTGGPDGVVCALRGVLIAPDENGHPKIALGTLVATVISTRDLSETGSVWTSLLFNEVATQIRVMHHLEWT